MQHNHSSVKKVFLGLAFIGGLMLLSLFSVQKGWSLTESQVKALERELNQALSKAGLPQRHFGLAVSHSSPEGPKSIWAINESQKMIPASLTKIVTAAAVLENLGPGKRLETHLLTTAPVKDGRLEGDLYLRGGGDPGFVSESMWFLVNEFLRSGVKKIYGDIVVDDSLFDSVRFDPSREPGRVDRAYDAPIGAMSFNWNAVNIFIRPGPQPRGPAQVYLDPQNSYLDMVNNTRTQGRGRNLSVKREVMSRSQQGQNQRLGLGAKTAAANPISQSSDEVYDRFSVSGHIGSNVDEVTIYRNISRPDLWSGHNLVAFLQQRGVEVKGQVRTGTTPSAARSLAKVESKPMSHMVNDLMKFSNNFVAEMLTKGLAAHSLANRGPNGRALASGKRASGASLEQGMQALKDYVLSAGIGADQFNLVNPSGLSRQNQFRPVDLVQLLNHLRDQPSYFPELLSSFPIAGVDGTLQSRFNNSSTAKGRIRAKTGLLNGVVGLAGYAPTNDGELLSFAFVYNGPAKHTHRAREILDDLAQILTQ